jgi:hypothetical protein
MTIKDTRYKLQKLNMALRNADLNQFQPRMRALTDFLGENKYCKELTSQLDRDDPRYEGWTINALAKRDINLNLSEDQRASLGFQAINHFIGKGSNEIIGVTTFLTSDSHLNSHVRAFYDTFTEPLCDWLGDRLENLEKLEAEPKSLDEEAEQLISRGNYILEKAEFDEYGRLIEEYRNMETQWVSEATHLLEEHVGTESELYKSFHRVGAGPVYPLNSGLNEEYKKKRIERFQSETGSRLAYLETLKKVVSKKKSNSQQANIIPKVDIAKQLTFIRGKKLKEIVSRDLYEAQLCMDCSHKSVVILCGGVVEAVLIYRLSQGKRKTNAITQFRKQYPKAKNLSDINSWSFEQLINIAKQVKLIDEGIRLNLHAIRNFRNFVHPYREIKSTSSPDSHLATIALESAMHLVGLNKT